MMMDGVVTKKLCVALFCGICLWALCVEVLVVEAMRPPRTHTALYANSGAGNDVLPVVPKCGVDTPCAECVGQPPNTVCELRNDSNVKGVCHSALANAFPRCKTTEDGGEEAYVEKGGEEALAKAYASLVPSYVEKGGEEAWLRNIDSYITCDNGYREHLKKKLAEEGKMTDDSHEWYQNTHDGKCKSHWNSVIYSKMKSLIECLNAVEKALEATDKETLNATDKISSIVEAETNRRPHFYQMMQNEVPECKNSSFDNGTLDLITKMPKYLLAKSKYRVNPNDSNRKFVQHVECLKAVEKALEGTDIDKISSIVEAETNRSEDFYQKMQNKVPECENSRFYIGTLDKIAKMPKYYLAKLNYSGKPNDSHREFEQQLDGLFDKLSATQQQKIREIDEWFDNLPAHQQQMVRDVRERPKKKRDEEKNANMYKF